MRYSGELFKTGMLRELWMAKDWLIRFQRGTENSLEAILAEFWQRIWLHLPMS